MDVTLNTPSTPLSAAPPSPPSQYRQSLRQCISSQYDLIVRQEREEDRPELTLSSERVKILTKAADPAFDEKVFKDLQSRIRRTQWSPFSTESLLKAVQGYVFDLLEGEFRSTAGWLKDQTYGKVLIFESQKALRLVQQIQTSTLLLEPVLPRLEWIRIRLMEICEGEKKKSDRVLQFLQVLKKMMKVKKERPVNLTEFLKLWETELQDPQFREIALLAFGQDEKDQQEMLVFLKSFRKQERVPLIKEWVHQKVLEAVEKANIFCHKHAWFEPKRSTLPIGNISCYGVKRTFMPDEDVLFNSIKIQGKDIALKPGSKVSFFQGLFSEIAAGCKVVPNLESERRAEAELFLAFSDMNWKEIEETLKLFGPDRNRLRRLIKVDDATFERIIEKLVELKDSIERPEIQLTDRLIPSIRFLRPATFDAWGHGHSFLRVLFPKLFKSPFGTRGVSGMSFELDIKDHLEFSVRYLKEYAVYKKLNPDNPESHQIDESAPLANLSFCFTLSPHSEFAWKGILEVLSIKIGEKCSREHEEMIFDAVVHFDYGDIVELTRPETPKKRDSLSPPSPANSRRGVAFRLFRSDSPLRHW